MAEYEYSFDVVLDNEQSTEIINLAPPNGTSYNASNDSTDAEGKREETPGFYYYLLNFLAPGVFGVFTVIGIAGNGLVIYVIVSNPRMRSVTNLLLLNLASADVAFLFFCGPFTAYKYYAPQWAFGDIPCQLLQYLLYVSAYVTIYTLVAISLQRYLTIVWSHVSAAYRDARNAVMFIVGLWLTVLLLNIPTLTAHQTKQMNDYSYCGIEDRSIKPMFITFFVFGYAVPLSMTCVLYVLIVRYLRSQKLSTLDQQHARERNTRTCRVIVLVVVVFGISWLPHHVNSLVAIYGQLPENEFYQILRVLWNCMMYSNSCVNPVIYNYMSEEFRTGFRMAVNCKRLPKANNQKRLQSTDPNNPIDMV